MLVNFKKKYNEQRKNWTTDTNFPSTEVIEMYSNPKGSTSDTVDVTFCHPVESDITSFAVDTLSYTSDEISIVSRAIKKYSSIL